MTATDVIAARLRAIEGDARCVGCGATRASCVAQRGQDPTAPPWFGCCARGIGLDVPCDHQISAAAMAALTSEIETGTVRTVEEATPKPRQPRPGYLNMSWHDYLDQGEQWQPNGRPAVLVADMDETWRYNSARFLERNSAAYAVRYSMSEELWFVAVCSSPMGPSDSSADSIERSMHEGADERVHNPLKWIRTTVLYQALVRGLPTKPKKVAELAERARHWHTCPMRVKPVKSTCCNGSGFADYAAVPCPNPACPVELPRICTCARRAAAAESRNMLMTPEWTS